MTLKYRHRLLSRRGVLLHEKLTDNKTSPYLHIVKVAGEDVSLRATVDIVTVKNDGPNQRLAQRALQQANARGLLHSSPHTEVPLLVSLGTFGEMLVCNATCDHEGSKRVLDGIAANPDYDGILNALVDALHWYADPYNYSGPVGSRCDDLPILRDGGRQAHALLCKEPFLQR